MTRLEKSAASASADALIDEIETHLLTQTLLTFIRVIGVHRRLISFCAAA